MKEKMKMYHAFFPNRKWLWLVYLLYPILTIGIGSLWFRTNVDHILSLGISTMLTVTILDITELVLDSFVLGGIAAKNNTNMEYMKSSAKGVGLTKTALIIDGIRRIMTIFVCLGGIAFISANCEMKGEGKVILFKDRILFFLQCGISLMILLEVGLWIGRRIKNNFIIFVVIYFSSAIVCGMVPGILEAASVTSVIVSAMVLVLLMFLGRQNLMKKVKESYYDNGYKELHSHV